VRSGELADFQPRLTLCLAVFMGADLQGDGKQGKGDPCVAGRDIELFEHTP